MGEGQSKEAGNGSGSGSGSNSGSSPSSGPKALPDSSKTISPLRLRKGSSSSPSKKRNEIGSSATVPGAKKKEKEKEKEKGKKIKTHKEDKPHKESRFSSHRRRKSLAAPETNDNTSPSHNFSSSGYYNKFGPSSSAEQISKRREGILAQSKKQISDLEDQVAGSTEQGVPIKEKESPKEEEKHTPRGSKKASKKQVKSDSEAGPPSSTSSSSSSSHSKSKSKSPSVSLGSAVTKKHNKREPVGAYLEKKPVEVQGGSYLTKKPKDCSSSGDDSDSDSDDDVDWSNLDSDSDLSEEEDTDSDCEKKSKKPQKKEMSFLELISNIRTLSVDELMDVGKDLAEKNPSFVEDLREAVQDVLDMKRAIDSEDENDSDHETDVSSPKYHQVPETVPKSIALEHLEIHKGSACDWNARFQAAIEDLKEHGEVSFERMRIYSQLSNLAQDFIHCAKNYGRIIISEAETPFALKTIKPCNMGGFAGGEKYLVNNIMFKFAVDSRGFFDDSESAIKVAGHDLKGLVRYFNLGISGVHFPLMALVDYLGYRLTALSFLPINDNTLVYGSSDAGATVHASNETFNQKMMLAASLLNLKPHVIGNSKQTLWSAADIEGHEVDSKFYLVDFSRAFPPCKYDTTVRNSFMFRQFRPEFVKAYQKPLCPDAYTGFESAKDAPEHAKEIEVATRYLTSKVITSYAHTINRLPPKELDELQLKDSIHEAGINIRYLGFVRQYVTVEVIKHRILVEMVARVIKHIIRAKMREVMQRLKLPLEHSCRELVIDYLNLIFGSSPDSEVHWDKVIRSALLRNFPAALSDQETCYPLRRMLTPNDLCELFKMVCDMSHLVFSERAKHEFSTNPAVFTFEIPFDITDLEEIGVKVRDMNIVALAQGYVLKSKARAKQGRNSQRLCSLAIEKFRIALSDNLGDKRTLIELADATNILGDLALSDFYFKRAIACDMKDPNTLFKYAVFLEESMKKMDEAEEYYLRTLEHDPFHDHCLQRYGHFLDSRGLSDQAEEFYLRAADVRKARSQRLATRSSSNSHAPVVLSSPSVSVSSSSSSSSATGHHSD